MKRRRFIQLGSISAMTAPLVSFKNWAVGPDSEKLMPVLFVGHGSPMNAIENNAFTRKWAELGKNLPKPRGIIVVSAHWETRGTKVTANLHPETIHDFGGFPQALFDVQYPAPGNPELALELPTFIHSAGVQQDLEWGLDHGAWSVLKQMFPLADIPVIQLSLDFTKTPAQHFELAKELTVLRKKGILVVASGNIVHNLSLINWKAENTGFDWAIEFNDKVKSAISNGEPDRLINFNNLSAGAKLAVPSSEHYLPLLYAMALRGKDESVSFFNDTPVMGSLTMTSVLVG